MTSDAQLIAGLIEACRNAIAANARHLCDLDCAIGDGDHGTNMRRGADAVHEARDTLTQLPLPQAIEAIGQILVMTIGGAAGPLYGTLLLEMGRSLGREENGTCFAGALEQAIVKVAARGRAKAGDKTLLDVLYPVHAAILAGTGRAQIAERAALSACATSAMRAMRGRAAFLGERSVGHVDPGASSCALLTTAICTWLGENRAR